MDNHKLLEYSIRGHAFTIIETSQPVQSGHIQMFAIYSAGKLVYEHTAKYSLDELLQAIDENLPRWIERTRSHGHSVMGYDPRAPITELPG